MVIFAIFYRLVIYLSSIPLFKAFSPIMYLKIGVSRKVIKTGLISLYFSIFNEFVWNPPVFRTSNGLSLYTSNVLYNGLSLKNVIDFPSFQKLSGGQFT